MYISLESSTCTLQEIEFLSHAINEHSLLGRKKVQLYLYYTNLLLNFSLRIASSLFFFNVYFHFSTHCFAHPLKLTITCTRCGVCVKTNFVYTRTNRWICHVYRLTRLTITKHRADCHFSPVIQSQFYFVFHSSPLNFHSVLLLLVSKQLERNNST